MRESNDRELSFFFWSWVYISLHWCQFTERIIQTVVMTSKSHHYCTTSLLLFLDDGDNQWSASDNSFEGPVAVDFEIPENYGDQQYNLSVFHSPRSTFEGSFSRKRNWRRAGARFVATSIQTDQYYSSRPLSAVSAFSSLSATFICDCKY